MDTTTTTTKASSDFICITPITGTGEKATSPKSSTPEKYRSLLVQLPLPTADALDLLKVRRQQREGRIISKKDLLREAVEQFIKASAAE